MIVVFIVMSIGTLAALYFFLQKRTLYSIFGLLLMGVLTYLSFELTVWSYRPPLPVMMLIGLIPISVIAYGFRVYDFNRKREIEKRKNDDKAKTEEAVNA
jgi:hypothetical protein